LPLYFSSKIREAEEWQSRVVVDDVRQHFHRVLPETEQRLRGFHSCNQIDRMAGLLKDAPTKKGIQGIGNLLLYFI